LQGEQREKYDRVMKGMNKKSGLMTWASGTKYGALSQGLSTVKWRRGLLKYIIV
jgi:hypothetical protein